MLNSSRQKRIAVTAGQWTLVASIIGSSLVFIDGTVVAIALPTVQREFRSSATDAQWIIEAYTLVLAALLLLSGALADRYGRRRLFLLGVALFAAGSIACAYAFSTQSLIAARIVQALGGTMVAPASLAMLTASFSGESRGKAIGSWSAFTAIATMIGPIAGGALLDHAGWRWLFGINVPLALAAFVIAALHVPESRDEAVAGRIDFLGSGLICSGLALVVYSFITASNLGWDSGSVRLGCAAGVALLGVFWWWEGRAHSPLMPHKIFASRAFTGVNLMTVCLYAALSALFYFLPFVMIQADGYSATVTGLTMLPFIVLIVALSRMAGGLVYRIGARTTLTLGSVVVSAGYAGLGLFADVGSWVQIAAAMVMLGLGMGLTVAPLTTTVMELVPEEETGLAAGVNNAASRIAGLIAIAAFGFVLTSVFNLRLDNLLAAHPPQPAVRAQIEKQRAAQAGAVLADPSGRRLVDDAYKAAFHAVAIGCAILAAFSAATAVLTLGAVRTIRQPQR